MAPGDSDLFSHDPSPTPPHPQPQTTQTGTAVPANIGPLTGTPLTFGLPSPTLPQTPAHPSEPAPTPFHASPVEKGEPGRAGWDSGCLPVLVWRWVVNRLQPVEQPFPN